MKRHARTLLSFAPLWMVLGAANVSWGIAAALRVDGSRDVGWLWIWTRLWLQGTNPYQWPIPADYPPWALVSLSPIGVLPTSIVPAVWAATGVGLAIVVAWLGPKAVGVQSPLNLTTGIFLSWAAVRYGLGNGQFALVSVASGLAAVCLARRGSRWSGLFLGAALIKPHVGIAFAAWAIAAAQWSSIATAAAAVTAGLFVFAIRLNESAVSAAAQYVRQVGVEFQHAEQLRGSVEIRPLFESVLGNSHAAAIANLIFVAAACGAIAWVLSRQRAELRERLALPLFCLWTLASVFHNAYDLVLLWPVWLWIRAGDATESEDAPYLRLFMQVVLVAGVPGVWWKLYGSGVGLHADRALVVGLLIYVIAAHRAPATSSAGPALREVHGREPVQAATRHSSEVMPP